MILFILIYSWTTLMLLLHYQGGLKPPYSVVVASTPQGVQVDDAERHASDDGVLVMTASLGADRLQNELGHQLGSWAGYLAAFFTIFCRMAVSRSMPRVWVIG